MANTTTRGQFREQVLDILNDTDTSQVFQRNVINRKIREVDIEVSSMWKWQFLQERQQIIAPMVTHLAEALETNDTVIEVDDTTYYDNVDAVFIMQDLITFTGTTSDTLTGLGTIDVPHAIGQTVYPLLKLPSNYQKLLKVTYGGLGGQVPRDMMYVRQEQNDQWGLGWNSEYGAYGSPMCTTVNHNADTYLMFMGQGQGATLTVLYQKTPDAYVDDSSISSFPDEYIPFMVEMVAGQMKLFYDDDLDGMGTVMYNMAKGKLLKMAKEYGEREQGISRLVTSTYIPGRYTDIGINRGYINNN